MRMPTDQLFDDLPEDVCPAEVPLLLGDLDLRCAVEEHVAQLFSDLLHIALFDCLHELVALLEEEMFKRVGGLIPVPGAAVRRAQRRDESLDSFEAARKAAVFHCRSPLC